MENLEERISHDLKEKLREHRYLHSIGVMKKAEEFAKLYNLDINKARLVGLAHDIAKHLSRDEEDEYILTNNLQIDEIEKINRALLHSKIGADICKKEYGFDEQMCKAILYHTTGNKDMDLFAKIIFLADKTEENREYEDVKKLRELCLEDIDKAMIYAIDNSILYCIKKQELIHPDAIETRNFLICSKFKK